MVERWGCPHREADGSLRLTLTGVPRRPLEVQISSNLASWTALFWITNQSGTVEFLDPAELPSRFYRCVHQP